MLFSEPQTEPQTSQNQVSSRLNETGLVRFVFKTAELLGQQALRAQLFRSLKAEIWG